MDIPQLLDLGCKTVADMLKGKTPEEIRKTFKIVAEAPVSTTADEENQVM